MTARLYIKYSRFVKKKWNLLFSWCKKADAPPAFKNKDTYSCGERPSEGCAVKENMFFILGKVRLHR